MGNNSSEENKRIIDAIKDYESRTPLSSFYKKDVFNPNVDVGGLFIYGSSSSYSPEIRAKIQEINESSKFKYILGNSYAGHWLYVVYPLTQENVVNWIQNKMEKKEDILIPSCAETAFLEEYKFEPKYNYSMKHIQVSSMYGCGNSDYSDDPDIKSRFVFYFYPVQT